jgi:hypothetical protein
MKGLNLQCITVKSENVVTPTNLFPIIKGTVSVLIN